MCVFVCERERLEREREEGGREAEYVYGNSKRQTTPQETDRQIDIG